MSRPAEPAVPRPGVGGAPCHACRSPLAADQRYCLDCGTRRGAGGPIDFGGLLHGERSSEHGVGGGAPASGLRARALLAVRAPMPVAATMLLTLLLAGVLLGSLTSSRTLANGEVRPADVVLPASPASPPPAASPPVVPNATPLPPLPVPPIADPPVFGADPAGTAPAANGTDPEPATRRDDDGDAPPDATAPGKIQHVFVIRLGDAPVARPFAANPASPFLGQLVTEGTLLAHLRTVADSAIADAIALLSGQAPNAQTLAGCPLYGPVAPATIAADGQEEGEGCVYSAQTSTLLNQLDAQGLAWRAYIGDQAAGGATGCRRPALGAPDPWREPRPGDAYVTARNPFVYFTAITDTPGCAKNVVDLAELDADLAGPADDAPAFSYIAPGACDDGRAAPCRPGALAGFGSADAFLSLVVPKIRASKAYDDALVIVLFDRAFAAAAAPAAVPPSDPATTAPAQGATVGALLLSPHVRKGRTIAGRYDTYSLLAWMEDAFGLERLAGARTPVRRLGPGILEPGPG